MKLLAFSIIMSASAILYSMEKDVIFISQNENNGYKYNCFYPKNTFIKHSEIIKITVSNISLFHADTPKEWQNFLSTLPKFNNVEEIALEHCNQIFYGGLFSVGLHIGQLSSVQLESLLMAFAEIRNLKRLNLTGTFEKSSKNIKMLEDFKIKHQVDVIY